MLLAGLIVIATLMVYTRTSNKLKRAKPIQKPGEYISLSDSDSDEDSTDWENLMKDDLTPTESTVKASTSSKVPRASTAGDKGKTPVIYISTKWKRIAKRSKRIRNSDSEEEEELVEDDIECISEDRANAFKNKECIGERHVNIKALRERCSEFGMIIDQGNLLPICHFPETTGFCLHLVRTFYSNAQHLRMHESGPIQFLTMVRDKKMVITPQVIGEAIGMEASVVGTNYLKGCTTNNIDWQRVVNGICLPEIRPKGHSVQSKDLLPEYRILNYIVCYNVMPNTQTKVLRWERMVFLYLLGHPLEAHDLNLNIPYLIWSRMTKYIDITRSSERLPFPMIIMRILRKFDVDTSSSSYFYSQGTINDTTVVKSSFTRPSEASPSPSRPRTQQASGDDGLLTTIHREQQRLAYEQGRLSRKQEQISRELEAMSDSQVEMTEKVKSIHKLVKKMAEKMRCSLLDESDSN